MNSRDGSLRAGGNRVHPFRQRNEEIEKPLKDEVVIEQRYQEAAAFMHRTFVIPRGDRYIFGCSCGHAQVSAIGVMPGRVSILAQEHILDEADKLYKLLEGKPNE